MSDYHCPKCYRDISSRASSCKYCGYTLKPENQKLDKRINFKQQNIMLLLVFVIIIIILLLGLSIYQTQNKYSSTNYQLNNQDNSSSDLEKPEILENAVTVTPTPEPTLEPTPGPTITPTEVAVNEVIEFNTINAKDYIAIDDIIKVYYKAKLNRDGDILRKISNINISEQYLFDLKYSQEYIEDYIDIENYIEVNEENYCIVYTEYKIKYKFADTPGSALTRQVVLKDENDNWYIAVITDEISQYIEVLEKSEAVQELENKVKMAAEEQMNKDPVLKEIFGQQ